ncbi:MAG TPA: hypothetical protein VIK71_07480 [Flavobacteriales bacterium]
MEQNQILERIAEKIARLGEAKRSLEQTVMRLREENANMHRINKELQQQVDELVEKNQELTRTRSQNVATDDAFRGATRQRINELVKEVEECITLLKK